MDFDSFLRQACPPLDLEWRKYRRRAARHRVIARMHAIGCGGYEDYLEFIASHPEESDSLAETMRITVSRFFREQRCWYELVERAVLPRLDTVGGGVFRAWSVGCCGGEEPYTLSILWRETAGRLHPELRLEVTASDIDEPSLARAANATYGGGSLREVPPKILESWFHRTDGLWRLDEGARAGVRFRNEDFMARGAGGTFDLILCRYLAFTYYRGERRLAACRRFASSLFPGGILFTGRKEGLGPREGSLFEPLFPNAGIYRVRERPAADR